MKRFISGFFAVAMILSVSTMSAPKADAAMTTAEIMAAIANLQAQLSAMSGSTSTGSAVTFNTNLTIGSTGADVTSLQQVLVSKGFLQMPVNVSYGYFGPLTRSAVATWQASAGIAPAVGYFGPISRAALNSSAVVTTPGTGTVVCPVGFTCTSNSGGTTVGGITTPGVEGTLSVTSAPVSTGTVYEGDSMITGLAFKAKAQRSDIAVQRVTVDLGTNTTTYNKIFSKIYVTDESGSVLASADLNSNTVVKNGSRYEITLAGFSYVVSKDSTKTFLIKLDVRNSINTSDMTPSPIISLPSSQAVRGVDGAGIDQYADGSSISKTLSISASLTDSASLTLTTNVNNPLTQEVVAADGSSNDELDEVTLLTFDIKAEKDNALLTDLDTTITRTGGTSATTSSIYLYAGSTRIGSASVGVGGVATFSDIDYSISKDSTMTFSIKADVRSADSTQTTFTADVDYTDLTAENSIGDTITALSGTATGNEILVKNAGAVFSLVGTPTITKSATAQSNNTSTSTVTATFQLRMKAVGGAIMFGTNASTSPLVTNAVAAAPSFTIYKGGVAVATALVGASTTSFTLPSQGIVNVSPDSVTLQEDQEITVPVSFTFEGRTADGANVAIGTYAVGLANINYYSAGVVQASSFMAGQTTWRTSEVTLP